VAGRRAARPSAPDATGPRSINCYLVEALDFTAAASGGTDAKKFQNSTRNGSCTRCNGRHNATPSDFQLPLVRDPALWFEFVAAVLFDALCKCDPNLREWLRANAATQVRARA
jgi:hypothetical protein